MSPCLSPEAPLRVLVVDDEPVAVRRLSFLCARMEGVAVAGTARSAAEARDLLSRVGVDVILLDVEMPGGNGLSLAAELAGVGEGGPAVIFVTAYGRYALNAFEVAAEAYLVKPVEERKLRSALDRAGVRLRAASSAQQVAELLHIVRDLRNDTSPAEPEDSWLPFGRERLRVQIRDVTWLAAEADYVRVHLKGRNHLVRARFRDLCARLEGSGFRRVHRCRAVNLAAVKGITSGGDRLYDLHLADGSTVRTSKRFAPQVRELRSGGWIAQEPNATTLQAADEV